MSPESTYGSPPSPRRALPQDPWWKTAVFYQIYPRSFQDSNGDGIGDIPGIISRLDEIAALGVTAVWLSPLYRSPDADNGYDICDYCDIDPRYGTLSDFDALVAAAEQRGIRIVMDLVINHTSDEHPWFQASRARIEPYTDYYIWRPADSNDKVPNNWTGFFTGSAWEWDNRRQEYYLHLFDVKQPDLNYHNPAVIAEIKQIMRFWLDRGVAGFRCDVISLLYKTSLDDGDGLAILRGLEHYKAQPGTHEILRELRRDVLDPYDAFTVGETVMVTLQEAKDLCDTERGELDLVFYFDHLEVDRLFARYGPKPFRAATLLHRLTTWQQGLEWNAVYLENHDQPRIVSHYGDDKQFWSRSAKLFAVLLLTLRGTPFIFQGQEIGMTNGDFSSLDDLDDVESRTMDTLMRRAMIPQKVRWWLIRTASRDNARTPYQWNGSALGAGFTTGEPWLGLNSNSVWLNHARQTTDPSSVLNFYRKMIRLRASSDTLSRGGFEPVHADDHVMAYRRTPVQEPTGDHQEAQDPAYTVWLNLSGKTRRLKEPWLTSTTAGTNNPTTGSDPVQPPICVASNTGRRTLDGILLPWEAVVIRSGQARPWTAGHDNARDSRGVPGIG
ncbi:MAG: alpha-glucosidase [Propionibacteriaceae bacterium]|nr:alpha-glucosidase [Propionibacteriaceae bacterium]